MLNTWIVLLPPLLVIAIVLLTRRMILSFLIGLVSSALIVSRGNLYNTFTLSLDKLWTTSGIGSLTSIEAAWSNSSLLIFAFLIILGILIELLSLTGADQAYTALIKKRVKSKKAAEAASLILSLFFFIDDYFSVLTVGSVMRPFGQKYNVHPVKLAFLTTIMASPLVILSPISSWIGQIIMQIKLAGINTASKAIVAGDPYGAFVQSIPFSFYALVAILSTWYIVLRGISYGPMQQYDANTSPSNDIPVTHPNKEASLFDFMFPLFLLIGGAVTMLLFTGGFFHGSSLIEAFSNAIPNQAFFVGGLSSVIISSFYFLSKGTVTFQLLSQCIVRGWNLMYLSIIMLTCAWALGSILTDDLKTGSYLASLVSSFINLEFLPVICFLFAGLIAALIGSAWATMGLMFPIVIEMLQKLLHLPLNTPLSIIPLIFPIIGATLSGCIIGTHLSLISDNPILSSISTGANHVEHIKTMVWYVIPMGIASAIGFTLIGITSDSLGVTNSLFLGLTTGIGLSLLFLEIGQHLFAKQERKI